MQIRVDELERPRKEEARGKSWGWGGRDTGQMRGKERGRREAGLDWVLCVQGEEVDEDDAYQVLSTLKRITAFHK